jgi:hypothetical protein
MAEANQTCTMCGTEGLYPAEMCGEDTCKECLIGAL